MSSSEIDRLAESVRRYVEAPLGATPPAVRRARFVDAVTGSALPRQRGVRAAALASAFVVAGGLFYGTSALRAVRGEPSLTYQVDDLAGQQGVASYFAPATDQEVPLRFSDGSTVTLLGASRARIAGTTTAGASVVLETGKARFEVVHRERTAWTIATGPFTVSVTGTSFLLSWEPASGVLEDEMFSGSVVVRGPGAEAGVQVRDAHRFTISHVEASDLAEGQGGAKGALSATPPSSEPTPPVSARGDHERASTTGSRADGSMAKESVSAPSPREERWSSLAARGEYPRIMELVEARGVERALATADVDDLGALADAAKYTRHADLARRALLSVRSRFSGSPRAVSAAFLLGRMLDDSGGASAAIEWYDRYLAEGPKGSFAPEALGRRMLALRHIGLEGPSRRAAEEYLQQFPRGPYAGVAREISGH